MSEPACQILVVEDEDQIRANIVEILETAGYRTCSAGDASTGFRYLTSGEGLKLLITDVRIPGYVDGSMFARVAAEYRPDMPIVLISGYAPPRSGELPLHARFLSKPFTAAELLSRVSALLD